MKVKLLKKLRKKYYIKQTSYFNYYVEGGYYNPPQSFKKLSEAIKEKNKIILKVAREVYPEYSIKHKRKW
jgi:hypothetical protein